ncbi:hypothetical protein LY78DRAFT_660256 [Colletotrichum sublineola]|nr:hypothetical protein LY78DRAFT_660256 [Colletotrichum sublineola]
MPVQRTKNLGVGHTLQRLPSSRQTPANQDALSRPTRRMPGIEHGSKPRTVPAKAALSTWTPHMHADFRNLKRHEPPIPGAPTAATRPGPP